MAELYKELSSDYRVVVLARKWLSEDTFELTLRKPAGFSYLAGQKILCHHGQRKRDYSLVSSPQENSLAICVRKISGGSVSPYLATLKEGDEVAISKPYGFFTYREGRAVFAATGSGIAPFVAFAKSGVTDFILLHGVSSKEQLYYGDLLAGSAKLYVPCLSQVSKSRGRTNNYKDIYDGRVTAYLEEELATGFYNFYLSGNGAMIRDVSGIIDKKFPESKVYIETFF